MDKLDNNNQYDNTNKVNLSNKKDDNIRNEKKVILYLIIIIFVLLYFSLFFINDIVDRNYLKETLNDKIYIPISEQSSNGTNNISNNTSNTENVANETVTGNDVNENNTNEINNNVTQNTTNGTNINNAGNNTGNNAGNNTGNNVPGNNTGDGNTTGGDVPGEDPVNPRPPEPKPPVVDNKDRLKIKEGKIEFADLKELHLFENNYFKDSKKIAPGVSGTYSFTVENDTKNDYRYAIFFKEENIFNINMVYKIKMNGNYIIGSEDTWEVHRNFENTNIEISPYDIDVYTIEWKWQDAENDTEVGMTDGAYYKMHICMEAIQNVK